MSLRTGTAHWTLTALLLTACGAQPATDMGVPQEGATGTTSFKLSPVSGVQLNAIHYLVTTGNLQPIREGDFPTAGADADFSLSLQLPAGSGYQLSLAATSSDPSAKISCGGSYGPFSTLPGVSSKFSVLLECHEVKDGDLAQGAEVVTDACPRLVTRAIIATPAAAFIGTSLALTGSGYDLDGKAVVLSWELAAPWVGTLSSTNGEQSTLTCNQLSGGPVKVTLVVDNGQCKKRIATLISCTEATCGNGVIDLGENCDTALTSDCPADCTYVCGDGVTEPPMEDCDPPGPACSATCRRLATPE